MARLRVDMMVCVRKTGRARTASSVRWLKPWVVTMNSLIAIFIPLWPQVAEGLEDYFRIVWLNLTLAWEA